MATVPLGIEAYSRAASFQPETRLVNLYVEEDKSGASPSETMLLQRPGLARLATLDGKVRGIFQGDNNALTSLPIVVAGTSVYEIDDIVSTPLGTVPDDGKSVAIAASFERIVIVAAGNVYAWDGTTFAEIATPDDVAIVDVDMLNGYFILPEANGTFYWLVPGADTIAALDFATAEALPDGVHAVTRLRDELYFWGAETIEIWQTTGNADAPFLRAPGRMLDRGSLSRDCVQLFDNSVVWVGDDQIVYRLGDVPKRISTFGIEEKIRARTGDPSAWTFTSFGHAWYVLNLPGVGTYGYDPASDGWCEFSSPQLASGWLARTGTDTGAMTLCGDDAGKLYRLDPSLSTDDDIPFTRLVTGTIALPAVPVANSSLAVGVGSATPADFTVRWNDPRRGWSNGRTVRARGGSDVLNLWQLGLARAPYRSFEIGTVANQLVRISGAVANEGWRV